MKTRYEIVQIALREPNFLLNQVEFFDIRVRFPYGHPDVFDRIFHITRGGISKASRGINLSEEIFEAKVARGNGEQTLSRDLYRLGHRFDFFRMLSCYFTTVGFYVSAMLVVLVLYAYLYGRLYLSLSGLEKSIIKVARTGGNDPLKAAMASQSVVQLELLMALPMVMEIGLERGVRTALGDIIIMQLQLAAVFFTFSLGTKAHCFGRTILQGVAKCRTAGRGFVVRHEKFAENYRIYSRSHFVKGVGLMVLLISLPDLWLGSNRNRLYAPHDVHVSWESWWDEEQEHLQYTGWLGRFWEVILALRFFVYRHDIWPLVARDCCCDDHPEGIKFARYEYKDVQKENHLVFEQLLIESLEKFIRLEAQERSLESDGNEDDNDSEEESTFSKVVIAANGRMYSLGVPVLSEYMETNTNSISEAGASEEIRPAPPAEDSSSDAEHSLERELSFICKAKESEVVYLLGHGDISSRKDSGFIKKVPPLSTVARSAQNPQSLSQPTTTISPHSADQSTSHFRYQTQAICPVRRPVTAQFATQSVHNPCPLPSPAATSQPSPAPPSYSTAENIVQPILQYQHPMIAHLQAAKRILHYVFGTISHGLTLRRSSNLQITAYTDAD
ncbi:hypothetical protein CRG98_037365 [Punica granatum]|uniref:Glycosyl transferase 48 domain-containing protein n=1 Tax=Punica granatum TaxID=22663 RepID=A0A2I0IE20_PUNGR|nr:hypothetical protein CRG98_037365 [Punica granatum]